MSQRTFAALGLLLAAALPFGCAQNDPDAPDIGGYSTGIMITKVTAIPDVLPADGVSVSTLRLETHTRDGEPLPGRSIAFFIIGVDLPVPPPGTEELELKYCPTTALGTSGLGTVIDATDITDSNGVGWGAFQAGTGAYYGEVRDSDELEEGEAFDPCFGGSMGTPPNIFLATNFWTVVRGKITDPREAEYEYEIQDDVQIQHY